MRLLDHPSPNHGPRPPGVAIDMLILHYTGMRDGRRGARAAVRSGRHAGQRALPDRGGRHGLRAGRPRSAAPGMPASRSGRGRARHQRALDRHRAGQSRPRIRLSPFPRGADGRRSSRWRRDILARHPIPPRHVLGHSDVAPRAQGKIRASCSTGSGWRAPGIGLWPETAAAAPAMPPDRRDRSGCCAAIGYATACERTRSTSETGRGHRLPAPFPPGALRRRRRRARPGAADRRLRRWSRRVLTWPALRRSTYIYGVPDGRMAALRSSGGRKVRAPRKHGAG